MSDKENNIDGVQNNATNVPDNNLTATPSDDAAYMYGIAPDIAAEAENETADKIPVAEKLSAHKTVDEENSEIYEDDEVEIPAPQIIKKSGSRSLLSKRTAFLVLGLFTIAGASFGGYLYYDSTNINVVSKPVVKMKVPPVNIAKGNVPRGIAANNAAQKAPNDAANNKEGKVDILSEIMDVDDKEIAENKVDVRNSILSDVVPEDKKAKDERLAREKEERLAKAREFLAKSKLHLEDDEIEALAAEMAQEEKRVAEESSVLEDMLQEDVVYDEINKEEKKPEEPKTAEAPKEEEKKVTVIGGDGVKEAAKINLPKQPNKIDAAEVSDAELAIVQNSTILDTLPPPSQVPLDPREKVLPEGFIDVQGKTVSDILSQDAKIRPLPQQYVVVKKVTEEENLDSRLTSARAALAQGRYVASLELFNNLYNDYPENSSILMGRAVSMQKLGQNNSALTAYEETLRADPKNLEALTNMLGILKSQDSQTALYNLSQLRELYPYNADVTAQLGMVYGMVGDYENAVKYLDMADALKPDDMNILYNKAVAYDKMGKARQAAEIYRKIVYRASYEQVDRTFPIDVIKRRLASIR